MKSSEEYYWKKHKKPINKYKIMSNVLVIKTNLIIVNINKDYIDVGKLRVTLSLKMYVSRFGS